MTMRPATLLADLTENEWQNQVVGLARTLGWNHVYHTFNSRRSAHGFPDLVLLRERALFLELKREAGRLTDHQKDWLRGLHAAGAEAYVVRPSDLADIAVVLQTRSRPIYDQHPLADRTRQELGMT